MTWAPVGLGHGPTAPETLNPLGHTDYYTEWSVGYCVGMADPGIVYEIRSADGRAAAPCVWLSEAAATAAAADLRDGVFSVIPRLVQDAAP